MSTWLEYEIKEKTDDVNGLTVVRDPLERQTELDLQINMTDDFSEEAAEVFLNYSQVEALRDQLNQYLGQNDPNQEDNPDSRVADVDIYLASLSEGKGGG